MDKAINAAIITFFMSNIDLKTVEYNKKVVEKFNVSKYPHYLVNTTLNHGASMDLAWTMNGQLVKTFEGHKVPKKWDHDVLMFLDVDCLPLNQDAIDCFIKEASEGKLVGNIQRSNHIQNNQHVFAAPNAIAIHKDVFEKIGRPSAIPTQRADVAEEYTYAAEQHGVGVRMFYPLGFEEAPAECPSWPLADGMPHYGRGTTFGFTKSCPFAPWDHADMPLFWHQFQSFHPGQQAKFWKKAQSLLDS